MAAILSWLNDNEAQKWLNDNQGVVSAAIFLLTALFGWASGIFGALRRKPKLKLAIIPGPTLCTTFTTGAKHGDFPVHRTALSLYLRVSNVGTAATSIENVSLGYHWYLRPRFTFEWVRYRLFWYWLDQPAITMTDFQADVGQHIKIYPSLFQGSATTGRSTDVYLQAGQSVNGVVYFEQRDSWGGFMPFPKSHRTRVKVAVKDVFGTHHKQCFWIPVVPLAEAQKYNPSFGQTYHSLQQEGGKAGA